MSHVMKSEERAVLFCIGAAAGRQEQNVVEILRYFV